MVKTRNQVWTSGLAINLASNAIAAIVGFGVTYLSHDGSAWVRPVLCGGAAWLITFCSILAYRAARYLPVKSKPIDVDNVQQRIRDWLDKYNMTVKSVNDDDCHFLFIITTDGGKKVTIVRTKNKFSDYVEVRGLITSGEEEHAAIAGFSEDEKTATQLAILLELSRAVMGYKTINGVLEDVTIFKRIPITPSLNEEEIFGLVWEVEAMLGTIFNVGAMAVHRNKIKAQNAIQQ